MPDACRRTCYFVTNEENSIVCSRLELVYRRACPSHDTRLLADGGTDRAKTEIRRPATHALLLVGSVVIHVALGRMTLAPDAFIRDDIIRFGKIGRPRILRWDQVTGLDQNPMRSYVMNVAAVIVWVWTLSEETGEWIDPGARTDTELAAV
jgi:hypothetical protein